MEPVLITLFFLLTFIMTVHLLNMLIAIMGESFSENKENKEANQRMSELAFVVENWWIRPIKKQTKEKIVFLIAAFNVSEQDEDDEESIMRLESKVDKIDKTQLLMMQEMKEMN